MNLKAINQGNILCIDCHKDLSLANLVQPKNGADPDNNKLAWFEPTIQLKTSTRAAVNFKNKT